jgi:hypothetical protein
MNDFKLPSNFKFEEFQMVANGFFQAEGHISCRIRGKYFSPIFVINQNLNPKSLEYFVTLWHVLGRSGSLTLIKNKYDKIVIRLSSESWDKILNIYVKYFNSIYGEKYIAFQKLSTIRSLTSTIKNNDHSSLALAIHIVYSLSADGKNRNFSLSKQLSLFGLNKININIPNYINNFNKITIFFIIGFILGDGTFFLRLRKSDKGSIWFIPLLLLPQLKNKYNAHFFSMLENFFLSLNINFNTKNNVKDFEIIDTLMSEDNTKKMTILTVEGIHSIFE